ncbi:MAG: isoprenylcysteine carboxylmethyltransferase family protein [Acidimicrobiia bacterium]
MGETIHSTTGAKATAWTFVAVQAVLIVLMVLGPRDAGFAADGIVGALGTIASIIGALVGVWSAVYLGKGLTPSPLPNGATDLVSAGPYRWVRHPMYSAVMLFMAGVAARSGSWIVVAELIGLVVLFSIKAKWEEAQLAGAFDGYKKYAATTHRFIPGLRRTPPLGK